MFETIAQWLTSHADSAPLLVFGLLVLAGFSVPVSEDLVIITSGVLAGTVLRDQLLPLFIAVFLGSYLSDCEAYWVGRLIGPRLSGVWPFRKATAPGALRVAAEAFFRKYGFLALFIGRLIPFGVRNSVFMVAGAGKMGFGRFLLGDGLSCLLFSSVVFFLAFRAGEQYDQVHHFLVIVGCVAGCVASVGALAWFLWSRPSRAEA